MIANNASNVTNNLEYNKYIQIAPNVYKFENVNIKENVSILYNVYLNYKLTDKNKAYEVLKKCKQLIEDGLVLILIN